MRGSYDGSCYEYMDDSTRSIVSIVYLMMLPITAGEAHTYQIRDNAVKYIGSGELYDSSYSQYERSTTLPGNQLVDPETGIQYAVYFYPSDEMFSRYYSRTPIYACIGAVLLVVITG